MPALILACVFTCLSAGNAYWSLCSDHGPESAKIHASDAPCHDDQAEAHHCESEVCSHGPCTDRPLLPEFHPPKITLQALASPPTVVALIEAPVPTHPAAFTAFNLPAGPPSLRTTVLRL